MRVEFVNRVELNLTGFRCLKTCELVFNGV